MAQDNDNSNQGTPVNRIRLAEKIKKLRNGITLNMYRERTEDLGNDIENTEMVDHGKVIGRYVQKDGKLVESSASEDAQQSGIHLDAAKKLGVSDDIIHTRPTEVSEAAHGEMPEAKQTIEATKGLDNNQEPDAEAKTPKALTSGKSTKMNKAMDVQYTPPTDGEAVLKYNYKAPAKPQEPVWKRNMREKREKDLEAKGLGRKPSLGAKLGKMMASMRQQGEGLSKDLKDTEKFLNRKYAGQQLPSLEQAAGVAPKNNVVGLLQAVKKQRGQAPTPPESVQAAQIDEADKYDAAVRMRRDQLERRETAKKIPKPVLPGPKLGAVAGAAEGTGKPRAKLSLLKSMVDALRKNRQHAVGVPTIQNAQETDRRDVRPVVTTCDGMSASAKTEIPKVQAQPLDKAHVFGRFMGDQDVAALGTGGGHLSSKAAMAELKRFEADKPQQIAKIKGDATRTNEQRKKDLQMLDMAHKFLTNSVGMHQQAEATRDAKAPPLPRFSEDNSKLSGDGTISFNLPPGITCPGKRDCMGFCYAMTGPMSWPAAMKGRIDNWGLAERKDFVDIMDRALKQYPRKSKASKNGQTGQTVRIHDSGDFYSPEYMKKWGEIAKRHPDKKFYAYTKSLDMPWQELNKLPNFTIIQSAGGLHPVDPKAPHSIVVGSEQAAKEKGYQVCPEDSDACAANAKVNGGKIALLAHGARSANVEGFQKKPKAPKAAKSLMKSDEVDPSSLMAQVDQPDLIDQWKRGSTAEKLKALRLHMLESHHSGQLMAKAEQPLAKDVVSMKDRQRTGKGKPTRPTEPARPAGADTRTRMQKLADAMKRHGEFKGAQWQSDPTAMRSGGLMSGGSFGGGSDESTKPSAGQRWEERVGEGRKQQEKQADEKRADQLLETIHGPEMANHRRKVDAMKQRGGERQLVRIPGSSRTVEYHGRDEVGNHYFTSKGTRHSNGHDFVMAPNSKDAVRIPEAVKTWELSDHDYQTEQRKPLSDEAVVQRYKEYEQRHGLKGAKAAHDSIKKHPSFAAILGIRTRGNVAPIDESTPNPRDFKIRGPYNEGFGPNSKQSYSVDRKHGQGSGYHSFHYDPQTKQYSSPYANDPAETNAVFEHVLKPHVSKLPHHAAGEPVNYQAAAPREASPSVAPEAARRLKVVKSLQKCMSIMRKRA
jgi:hypothetical protein